LVLTHGDSLHLGGAPELLRDFPRVQVIDDPAPDRSSVHRRLQRLFQEHRVKPDDLVAGDNFRLSRDITAHVLFPPRMFSARRADDQTHVIQVSIAPSTSVLFMSDSGVETESALLANGLNLHSDIVIKGQHHSGNSCSGPFLDVVRPRLIIATSLEFPPNERISNNWAEELRTRGIKLFRQDETGAVTLRFGRDGWEAQSYLTGETFRSSSQ
jgi:competence protein ComEC